MKTAQRVKSEGVKRRDTVGRGKNCFDRSREIRQCARANVFMCKKCFFLFPHTPFFFFFKKVKDKEKEKEKDKDKEKEQEKENI